MYLWSLYTSGAPYRRRDLRHLSGFLLITYCICFHLTVLIAQPSAATASRISALSANTDVVHGPTRITEVSGLTIKEKPTTISTRRADRYTLLLALTPTCPYCRINFHNWRELCASKLVVPLWLDVSGTATSSYLTSYGIGEQSTFLLLSEQQSKAIGIEKTPTTIVLDHDGRVIWRADGVLAAAEMKELRLITTRPVNSRQTTRPVLRSVKPPK